VTDSRRVSCELTEWYQNQLLTYPRVIPAVPQTKGSYSVSKQNDRVPVELWQKKMTEYDGALRPDILRQKLTPLKNGARNT